MIILCIILVMALLVAISAILYLVGVDIELISLGWNIASLLAGGYLLFDIVKVFWSY